MSSHPCWKHLIHSPAKWQFSFPTESGPNTTHIHNQLTLESKQITVHLVNYRQNILLFWWNGFSPHNCILRLYFYVFMSRVCFFFNRRFDHIEGVFLKNDLQILFLYWINGKRAFFPSHYSLQGVHSTKWSSDWATG